MRWCPGGGRRTGKVRSPGNRGCASLRRRPGEGGSTSWLRRSSRAAGSGRTFCCGWSLSCSMGRCSRIGRRGYRGPCSGGGVCERRRRVQDIRGGVGGWTVIQPNAGAVRHTTEGLPRLRMFIGQPVDFLAVGCAQHQGIIRQGKAARKIEHEPLARPDDCAGTNHSLCAGCCL